jgi:outer membrane protein assembly factor BamB
MAAIMTRRYAWFLLYCAIVVTLAACGGTDATQAKLTAIAPQITTQPANQTVIVGQSATFGVTASGSAPLMYQWRKNGSAISGATGSSYQTPATGSGDNESSFTVVVSNAVGSVTSNTATLTVTTAPTAPQITSQPANRTVIVGQSATFGVAASGSAPLTYQWRKNGNAISGATGSSYKTPATVSGDNGSSFTVIVSNAVGNVTSNAATLTVTAAPIAPQITSQPSNRTVIAGQSATFSVAASGSAPLTYQWQKNRNAISGATGSSYQTPATVSGDNGSSFTVIVSNAVGSVTSNAATLTVTAAPIAPQITSQPSNRTVIAGQSATFSVAASGSAPLTYQWQKNRNAISGATGSSYQTPATVSGDNGSSFTVIVSNAVGSVTSNAATLTVTAAVPGVDVVTYKYDVMRTGQNLAESTLTPSNVAFTTFGKLRSLAVDGIVDASPLYISQLTVAGAPHNVVFVATESDSVYAFDADTGANLWKVSLLGAGETRSDDLGCADTRAVGITSTPVIDRKAGAHGTIFVVAMSTDAASNHYQRLHALDITTGQEAASSPTEITATFGATTFAPGQYKERAALLLSNGTIYTTWASHCDSGPYGGWIIAVSESTLEITGALNVALGASGSGFSSQGPSIWMSGGGPAADSAGNVYVLTANGRFETTLSATGFPDGGDYGNSFVKVSSTSGALTVSDYFTMSGEIAESSGDVDLGSGGVVLLPDMADANGTVRQLAVGAGKDGNMYIVDRNNMGKFTSVGNTIYQELKGVMTGGIWSTPAYFNSTIYYGPRSRPLMAFSVSNALVSSSPVSQSSTQFGDPGPSPMVSANGTSNAIVWVAEQNSPGVLHAYAATDLATELYNSSQAPNERDQLSVGNSDMVPVVADGKVFVATGESVAVFGLLP